MLKNRLINKTILLSVILLVSVLCSSCGLIGDILDDTYDDTADPGGNTTTYAPDLPDNFPVEFKEHIFVLDRGMGSCDKLMGKVSFMFIFVNDPENTWEDQQIEEYKDHIETLIQQIKSDATERNIGIDLSVDLRNADVDFKINNDEYTVWADAVLKNLKLPSTETANTYLEKLYEADEAPIVFITPVQGRSFAHQTYSPGGAEFAIIHNEPEAMYHEICHLFGAVDLYFPDSVRESATQHFPDSIMLNSTNENIDDLTEFLVGWTDFLSDEASAFLNDSKALTEYDMKKAFEAENYTGFVYERASAEGVYTGQLLDGYCHGQGKFVFSDGDVYEGEWKYNRQHGKGTYTNSIGQTYTGDWFEGRKQGVGTVDYENGDRYEGEWLNGNRHGKGTYTWSNGAYYTGDWVDGSKNGYGTVVYENGAKFEGNWVNDRQNGKGTYYWTNGDSYDGDWVDGAKNGYGTYYWAGGSYYSGNWVNDCRHGWGQVVFADGSTTTGAWENDQFIG